MWKLEKQEQQGIWRGTGAKIVVEYGVQLCTVHIRVVEGIRLGEDSTKNRLSILSGKMLESQAGLYRKNLLG